MLSAQNLRRTLGKESFLAVDDVSLRISPGEILCLLGPNGAGKTTTIRMCSTLLIPTEGTVRINGIDAVAHPARARTHLGLVLGGDRGFYMRASARDNLLFFADVAGVPRKLRTERVSQALEAVNLTDRASEKVQGYSRGMKQRLHIARALLNNPKLLLLDEPANGLDPDVALQMRRLVRTLADSGVGILLTTHYMAEAEELADRIIVLKQGRVQVEGTAADIADAAGLKPVVIPPREGLVKHPTLEQSYLALIGMLDDDARDASGTAQESAE